MGQQLMGYNPHSQEANTRLRVSTRYGILGEMENPLLERIDERLLILKISGEDASKKAGLNRDTIRDLRRGRRKTISSENLIKLARALETNPSWLLGEEGSDAEIREQEQGIPYGGIVEAGAFRPVDMLDQTGESQLVPIQRDPRFPKARQYALEVKGDSMTEANIRDGMWVVMIDRDDFIDQKGGIRDGSNVVVSKSRNGERELTVKEIRIFQDRTELHPRSENKAHKIQVLPNNASSDDGMTIEILGVVSNAVWLMQI